MPSKLATRSQKKYLSTENSLPKVVIKTEHEKAIDNNNFSNIGEYYNKINDSTLKTNNAISIFDRQIKKENWKDEIVIKSEPLDYDDTNNMQYDSFMTDNFSNENVEAKVAKKECLDDVNLKEESNNMFEEIYIKEEPILYDEPQMDVCGSMQNTGEASNSTATKVNNTKNKRSKSPFKCEICNKIFKKSIYLFHHSVTHTGKKPYVCDICDRSFGHPTTLITHKRWHTGEKPYKCPHCDKDFRSTSCLSRHRRAKACIKPYKCDKCRKAYKEKRDLLIHVQRYHDESRSHVCLLCKKDFKRAEHLNLHMRTHSGEKPFMCNMCPYRCTTGSGLKCHIRKHTGEKPYSCQQCEKAFSSLKSLKRHGKLHE